jgi:anti-sigma factor RsiW
MTPSAIFDRLLRRDLVCRQVVELVTGYLEGTLAERDRRRFEQHISACPHCTVYVEQMRAMLEQTGSVSLDGLSPQAERELLDAFAGWQSSGV